MLFRNFLEDCTALVRTYSEEIIDESEDVEEGIEEGAANHASEVLAYESEEGSGALGGSLLSEIEVPLYGIARHDVVDYIARFIHESLRN